MELASKLMSMSVSVFCVGEDPRAMTVLISDL